MKTYQIHFIRHGIIDGNLSGKYIGSTDCSLCEKGREQLKALAENYEYPGAGAFFTSPMKRCTETLSILYPDATPIVIDAFREICFGEFEGKDANELFKNKDFSEWLAGGGVDAPPGGESSADFAHRVCEIFEMVVTGIMKTGITSVVIVAHAGVIMTILSRYGLPQAPMNDWLMDNGCGYSVRIHPQLWSSGKVFEVYDVIPRGALEEMDDEQRRLYELGREAASIAGEEKAEPVEEEENE